MPGLIALAAAVVVIALVIKTVFLPAALVVGLLVSMVVYWGAEKLIGSKAGDARR